MRIDKAIPPKVGCSYTEDGFGPDDDMEEFCRERGLERWVGIEAGLHYVDGGEYDGMLAIPYQKRNGGDWQCRYKTGHDKPKYLDEPGASLHLYNPQHLGPHTDQVWFTEGEVDALILWQYDVPALGISGNTKYGTVEFQQSFKLLFDKAEIISAVDNDDAGDIAHQDLVKAFGPKVKRFKMPEGMDVNDWHLADSEGLRKEIAKWMK